MKIKRLVCLISAKNTRGGQNLPPPLPVRGLSDRQRRIQNFHYGGAAGPEGAVLAIEGVQIYLEVAGMVEKAPFRARGHLCWRERRHTCLEGRIRGRKERLLLSEGRIRWREGAHITPSVQKRTPGSDNRRIEMNISAEAGAVITNGEGCHTPQLPLDPPLLMLKIKL